MHSIQRTLNFFAFKAVNKTSTFYLEQSVQQNVYHVWFAYGYTFKNYLRTKIILTVKNNFCNICLKN